MKRFSVLFALIIAIILVTIISVVITLFTFGVIQECFEDWFTSHFFPQVHETGAGRPDVPFDILSTIVGWNSVYHLCRYWIRMALGAPAPAAPEGKAGNWIPSTYGEQNIRGLHFSAFVALTIVVAVSCISTFVTFFMFYKRFSLINIIAVVVGWILAHRLWRTWKRTAPHAPAPAEAPEIRGIP
jgi:hypothetical protein